MNVPKINIGMPQVIIDTCASDDGCTCETCLNDQEECTRRQEATLWLEVDPDLG